MFTLHGSKMDDDDRKSIEPLLSSASSETASEVYDTEGNRLGPNYGTIDGDGVRYDIPESRKIGVAGAVFLILNKMIGTGSELLKVYLSTSQLTVICSLLNAIEYIRIDRLCRHELVDVGSGYVPSSST